MTIEQTEYNGSVGDLEIRKAEDALTLRFPDAWRNFIQADASSGLDEKRGVRVAVHAS
jgi:hypothetical protein